MMRLFALFCVFVPLAMAMPGDDEIADEIEGFLNGTQPPRGCNDPECKKPNKAHEQIQHTQPGYQWNDGKHHWNRIMRLRFSFPYI